MSELCPHGRVAGHVCLDCESGTAEAYVDPFDEVAAAVVGEEFMVPEPIGSCTEIGPTGEEEMKNIVYDGDREFREHTIIGKGVERKPTGLDAAYYDLPENIHSAQDLIEYLGLNFANGNILKSLVRQHGSTTKETDELYETEKRYYFAKRELERVRRSNEMGWNGKRLRWQMEESLRKETASESTSSDGEQGVSR